MQESRGGSGGAPRARQFEWAAAQKLRGATARHKQETQARAGKRVLLQKTRERKRSQAVVPAGSSAGGMGFVGAPVPWRRLQQPDDGSIDVSKVESLLLMRAAVLGARNYEAADELRWELARLGVALSDEERVWWLKREDGACSA
jgi:cysteinyl-tRNA synthetase